MSTVITEAVTVHASADAVWAIAGDPASIGDWVPALTGATFADGERVCTTGDGGEIRERIVSHSDAERTYSYEIVASPLPLRSYRSTLAVHGHDDHSHVTWEAQFEALAADQEQELEHMIGELYRTGLASLRERVELGAAS